MGTQMNRPEFDFDTVNEARESVASMFDTDTLEGQRYSKRRGRRER